MDKIKVLHMPLTNSGSGVTQYVLQNWRFIDRDRFRFDIATRSPSLDFADEINSQGGKIHYLSCSSDENEEQFIQEMKAILDEGYDAIHLHTSYWKSFIVEELAIERGVPKIIVHSHSTMVDVADPVKREALVEGHYTQRSKFSRDLATDFWACSNLAAEWLFGTQIPRDRIRILNNAIDVQSYSYNPQVREQYRRELGLNDCVVLGHAGRFVYQKNHELLVDIFHATYRHLPNARLMLVGNGPLEDNIRQRVSDYGLSDAVLFMGRREDVPELMQAMDMFLLPSRFEGLGLVLIEAQAAGLKCLTSSAVPIEAQVTSNLDFISGGISDWVKQVLTYANGYERIRYDRQLELAGYDLRKQIKVIERLYVTK
ncbi:glycosyltransferase [Cohnella sp. GCM10027633]|uniref:glycosyltransferase n=1 Tax=unclassified Cohnella TaxID=2636738 RepID=UPI003631D3A9